MDIYFAGGSVKDLDIWVYQQGYNRLTSYVNDQPHIQCWIDMEKENKNNSKLFVDSGAFSMWTKGNTIDVDEYIDWINERSEYINLFGQVDVIPGEIDRPPTQKEVNVAAKQTWENYLYMKDKVKDPDNLLYTFHVGEPIEYLKTALEYKNENNEPIKYLALGGMVGKSAPVRKSFLDSCFKAISESSNPHVKVHTFGMTSKSLLSQYPITSADSTGWLMTAVNGYIYTKYGTIRVSNFLDPEPKDADETDEINLFKKTSNKDNKTDKSGKLNLNSLNEREVTELRQYIEDQGFTLKELQESHILREEFNIKYLVGCMENLVQKTVPRKLHTLFNI